MTTENLSGVALGGDDLGVFRSYTPPGSPRPGTARSAARCPCPPACISGRAPGSIARIRTSASRASSPFSLATRSRTRSLSSALAIASEGSLQISVPAAVLVARQSKFGSVSISIRSSVSLNRQGLIDLMPSAEMLCFAENAAAGIAILDPFGVFLDREAAIGEPVQPVLDRDVQLRAGSVELGVAAEQLLGRVAVGGAMIGVVQRQRLADRPLGSRRRSRASAGNARPSWIATAASKIPRIPVPAQRQACAALVPEGHHRAAPGQVNLFGRAGRTLSRRTRSGRAARSDSARRAALRPVRHAAPAAAYRNIA